MLGVAFGYARHATAMGAQSLHGDWPGRAMSTVEAKHPEVVALHINGCSGDQNPLPRRTIPLLEKYVTRHAAVFTTCQWPCCLTLYDLTSCSLALQVRR